MMAPFTECQRPDVAHGLHGLLRNCLSHHRFHMFDDAAVWRSIS